MRSRAPLPLLLTLLVVAPCLSSSCKLGKKLKKQAEGVTGKSPGESGAETGKGPPVIEVEPGSEYRADDGLVVRASPGSLAPGARLEVRRDVPSPDDTSPPGEIIEITSETEVLMAPIRLELPLDESRLPQGTTLSNVYPVTYRHGRWDELPGTVDEEAGVLRFQTTHLCLFSWLADEEHEEIHNPFREAYLVVAPFLFGPELDVHEALLSDRDEYDAIAEELATDMNAYELALWMESGLASAPAAGTVTVHGETLEIVDTGVKVLPDGSQTFLAVRSGSGARIEDREKVFEALFTWRARAKLLAMDRDEYAKTLRQNASLLRKMRAYHGIAQAMDVTQKVLADILAVAATGTTKIDYKGYVETAIDQVLASIANLEMLRVAMLFDQAALELERFDGSRTDYTEVSHVYSTVVDARTRIDAVRALGESTFPGYDQNWALYTGMRVADALLMGMLDEKVEQAKDVSDLYRELDLLDAAAELDHAIANAELTQRGKVVLGIAKAAAHLVLTLIQYFQASVTRSDIVGMHGLWAEALILTRDEAPGPDTEILSHNLKKGKLVLTVKGVPGLSGNKVNSYAWWMDGGKKTSGKGKKIRIDIRDLPDGVHELHVAAIDKAGAEDMSPATLRFDWHRWSRVSFVKCEQNVCGSDPGGKQYCEPEKSIPYYPDSPMEEQHYLAARVLHPCDGSWSVDCWYDCMIPECFYHSGLAETAEKGIIQFRYEVHWSDERCAPPTVLDQKVSKDTIKHVAFKKCVQESLANIKECEEICMEQPLWDWVTRTKRITETYKVSPEYTFTPLEPDESPPDFQVPIDAPMVCDIENADGTGGMMDEICGDGWCEGDEDCESCPDDCECCKPRHCSMVEECGHVDDGCGKKMYCPCD